MRITRLIALLLLVGCAPTAPYLAPRNTEEAATAATCAGRLDRVGKLQALRCIVTYADAGKACTDGAQCLGKRCMGDFEDATAAASATATGTCTATNNPFGCQTIVEAGVARTLCVD